MMTDSQGQSISDSKQSIFFLEAVNKLFGLNVSHVREVLHLPELILPPGLPSFIAGFINISGHAMPVVDLPVLLGFSRQSVDIYTPLVILKDETKSMALLVTKVLGVEAVEDDRIYPLDDEAIFNQCVSNSGKNTDDETFYLLSPERILLVQERQLMTEFQEKAQRRLEALQTTTGGSKLET